MTKQFQASQKEKQQLDKVLENTQKLYQEEKEKTKEFVANKKTVFTKPAGEFFTKSDNSQKRGQSFSPYKVGDEKKGMFANLKGKHAVSFKNNIAPHMVLQLSSLSLAQKETIKFLKREHELSMNKIALERMQKMVAEEITYSEMGFQSEEFQAHFTKMQEMQEILSRNITDVLSTEQKTELDQLVEQSMNGNQAFFFAPPKDSAEPSKKIGLNERGMVGKRMTPHHKKFLDR